MVNLNLDTLVNAVRAVTGTTVGWQDKVEDFIDAFKSNNANNPFGDAALKDTGTDDGDIPVLGTGGKLAASTIPDVPDDALPAGVTRDSEVENFAKVGNTAKVPTGKIPDLPADRITTGQLPAARVGALPASKVTSGLFDSNRIPVENFAKIHNPASVPDSKINRTIARNTDIENFAKTSTTTDVPNSRIPSIIPRFAQLESFCRAGTANQVSVTKIPGLAASKIVSGVFNLARIPGLAASKITSGILAIARIPDLAASKITSGTFNVDRIPGLAADKVTSGTFDKRRLPAVNSNMPDTLGTAGQALVVNSGATALEFGAARGFDITATQTITLSATSTAGTWYRSATLLPKAFPAGFDVTKCMLLIKNPSSDTAFSASPGLSAISKVATWLVGLGFPVFIKSPANALPGNGTSIITPGTTTTVASTYVRTVNFELPYAPNTGAGTFVNTTLGAISVSLAFAQRESNGIVRIYYSFTTTTLGTPPFSGQFSFDIDFVEGSDTVNVTN